MWTKVSVGEVMGKLEPGEEVIWCQAGPKLWHSTYWLVTFLVLLIWTAFGLGLAAVVGWRLIDNHRDVGWAPVILLLTYSAIGVYGIQVSVRRFSASLRTLYLITDRAALIVEAVRPMNIRRFEPKAVAMRWSVGDRIGFPPVKFLDRFDFDRMFVGVKDMESAHAALERVAQKAQD